MILSAGDAEENKIAAVPLAAIAPAIETIEPKVIEAADRASSEKPQTAAAQQEAAVPPESKASVDRKPPKEG
jgi:hypothetical protein